MWEQAPEYIQSVLSGMEEDLSINQMRKLQEVMLKSMQTEPTDTKENNAYLQDFIDAKRVEGCSERTLDAYRISAEKLLSAINKDVRKISTEDIRNYLIEYPERNHCGNITIDNHRRNLSSFFTWLEAENYILKSPMSRIKKVKTKKAIKKTITDEDLERLRDAADNKRDLAMIDMLVSTGMRVSELVNLDIDDVDIENKECVVLGKGNKERVVYFDARTKIHLTNYLNSRTDSNKALFVTLDKPHDRLKISGVEIRVRQLGRTLNIEKVHPHKFRRTMATRAISHGMPIEQVQQILGHNQIDTTMEYAIVDNKNVKYAHQKYLG